MPTITGTSTRPGASHSAGPTIRVTRVTEWERSNAGVARSCLDADVKGCIALCSRLRCGFVDTVVADEKSRAIQIVGEDSEIFSTAQHFETLIGRTLALATNERVGVRCSRCIGGTQLARSCITCVTERFVGCFDLEFGARAEALLNVGDSLAGDAVVTVCSKG